MPRQNSLSIETERFAALPSGVRLHYAHCGPDDQPLLLLLHGFPECWLAWRELMPMLADRFHVVAPDLRGYNLSDRPSAVDRYRIPDLVSDVSALLEHLGRRQCALVGHDWGGALAWAFAIARPQQVSQLAILNAPHPWLFAQALAHDAAQQQASAYMNWLRRPGAEAVLAQDDFARLRGILTGHGDARWFSPELSALYRQAWSQDGALTGMLNWYRATPLHPPGADGPGAAALNLRPADFTVSVPTLVLWGMADVALLPVLLEGLPDCVPQLDLRRIEGLGHWLVHENPQLIAEHLRSFLLPSSSPLVSVRLGAWPDLQPLAQPIRTTVFVDEQGIDPALEWDVQDAVCLHAVAFEGATPIGTGRLLPDGHIGRMAVRVEWRRHGVGGRILQALVDAARARGDAEVVLSAQCYVAEFYAAHGFIASGEPYEEAGIAHIQMRKRL
jgi:pimeloyl-ACP methyl ester carboxylesterase/predicted GNAT family N-acyltransferase